MAENIGSRVSSRRWRRDPTRIIAAVFVLLAIATSVSTAVLGYQFKRAADCSAQYAHAIETAFRSRDVAILELQRSQRQAWVSLRDYAGTITQVLQSSVVSEQQRETNRRIYALSLGGLTVSSNHFIGDIDHVSAVYRATSVPQQVCAQ